MISRLINGDRLEYTPIWIMRQAGRYLPEYRRIREKYDFLTMCRRAELVAEITLLPVKILNVDAAILFSDILIPAQEMGFNVNFVEEHGPLISPTIKRKEDLDRIVIPDSEAFSFITVAVKETISVLPPEKELIGFSAAPFTLLSYLVGGNSKKGFSELRRMMLSERTFFDRLMEKAKKAILSFAKAQAEGGIRLFQLFDSWVGVVSKELFKEMVLPTLRSLVTQLKNMGMHVIYFSRNSVHLLPEIQTLEVDAVSVDWLLGLGEYDRLLKGKFPLQGNMDPAVLLSDKKTIEREAQKIIEEGKRLKGHIFNLGHGILPETPVENARFLVETVHKLSSS